MHPVAHLGISPALFLFSVLKWTARNGKQPYLIRLRNDELMGLGGLLERWRGPEGDVMTFTILTIDANPLMAKIHDRMPVIIRPEDYAAWTDTNLTDVAKIQAMALTCPGRFMETYPISRKINSPQYDSPDLIVKESDRLAKVEAG